jgi:hypothetical protein
MKKTFSVMMIVLCQAAWASDPGEPIDCADFVFHEPGHTCSIQEECFAPPSDECDQIGTAGLYDNEGRLLTLESTETIFGSRIELTARDAGGTTVIAEIAGRENPLLSTRDFVRPPNPTMSFDAVNGVLVITLQSSCFADNGGTCTYVARGWRAEIPGFTPLLDIFQSYEPASSSLSFVVPKHPEGLATADFFDTFVGVLPVDFAEAQGLECGITAPDGTAPVAGDLIMVADTLPQPSLGEGYWYVTAVNEAGSFRYGRASTSGTLHGRDPALFPTCS